MNKKALICALFCLLLGWLVSWLYFGHKFKEWQKNSQCDTITVVRTIRDTIRIEQIKLIEVKTIDTVYEMMPVHDTTLRIDSVMVSIPLEQKTFADSSYKIQTTGYHTTLDFVEVYPQHEYIENTIYVHDRKKHWGIGIQAGYGVGISNKKAIALPYVGLGISYNLLTF